MSEQLQVMAVRSHMTSPNRMMPCCTDAGLVECQRLALSNCGYLSNETC